MSSPAPQSVPPDVFPRVTQYLSRFFLRHPLLLTLLPFAVGISGWEFLSKSWSLWPVLFCWVVCLCSWLFFFRSGWQLSSRFCLLVLCGFTGMLHYYASELPASRNDVRQLVQSEPRLIRIQGRLLTNPVVKEKQVSERAPDWQRVPSTTAELAVEQIYEGDTPIEMTGRLWLTIRGKGLEVNRDDQVMVLGWLEQPFTASNPGEFDFRAWLRHQGIHGVLRAKETASVQRISLPSDKASSFYRTWPNWIRNRWLHFAEEHLQPENQNLAAAMILGVRSGITPEQQEQFSQTGTMHLLAVSGLHVGILIFFLIVVLKLIRLPHQKLLYVIIICIWGYAFITDMNPPVLRASFLATFLFTGKILLRQASLMNLLALAGLLMLFWQPSMLFDVGAQLSFLAVAGIIWSNSRFVFSKNQRIVDGRWWQRIAHRTTFNLKNLSRLTFSIWLFTAPLILLKFHFIAPIGLLINVLLAPLVLILLWAGYLMSLALFLLPPLAFLLAVPFDSLLSLFRYLVETAHEQGWGTWYAPEPPVWFLIAYYGGLVGVAIFGELFSQFRRWGWISWGTVLTISFCILLLPTSSQNLVITILNVGHGSAVLVEYPNGKRLLYDLGSSDGGKRAANVVESVLWNEGKTGVDCLLISHADVDHFSGTDVLLEKMPIASVCCSPQFIDFHQPAVEGLIQRLEKEEIPVRLVQAGDELLLDNTVTSRVLYPEAQTRLHQDNDHSLVLFIEYAGRRILLTGDLEPEGQQHLQHLLNSRLSVDVLTSPHHGAREANSRLFFEQFSPRITTVSSNDYSPQRAQEMQEANPEGEAIYFTRRDGAIRIEIARSGVLKVHPYLLRVTY
ncbi:MAG: DNA internalization-related competence protein ComEC/Rec2 [Planctomycetaceae bacterium]|nr:DNA internalization-related competence protein ComEC/Rec2 [Planctomycetaceae bacterium]